MEPSAENPFRHVILYSPAPAPYVSFKVADFLLFTACSGVHYDEMCNSALAAESPPSKLKHKFIINKTDSCLFYDPVQL